MSRLNEAARFVAYEILERAIDVHNQDGSVHPEDAYWVDRANDEAYDVLKGGDYDPVDFACIIVDYDGYDSDPVSYLMEHGKDDDPFDRVLLLTATSCVAHRALDAVEEVGVGER